jgi:hypothetical protein
MRFINLTVNPKVSLAIHTAESVLTPFSSMAIDLGKKHDWKYDTKGSVIWTLLKKENPIDVFTYRSFNPFSKTSGYFKDNEIHLNLKFVEKLNYKELAGVLLHEYAHYCGFHHGNNFKTEDKCLYSVPYYLSENIENWI